MSSAIEIIVYETHCVLERLFFAYSQAIILTVTQYILEELGCCNKLLKNDWVLNNINLFLAATDVRKAKIKVMMDSVCIENPFVP